MDIKKFSLTLFASLLTLGAYDNIDEALKNGVTKGSIGLYSDYYDPFATGIAMADSARRAKIFQENNLQDASYVALTMELQYRSAFYKNMRFSVGFGSAFSLWQWHKNSSWNMGDGVYQNGDINLDFDSSNPILLKDTYLEYFDGDTAIKAGRFFLQNEWVSNQVDGFWVRNRSLENLLLELYWIDSYGDVTPTLMSALTRYNPNWSGLTYAATKYNYTSKSWEFWAKAYTSFAYSVNYVLGAGAGFEYKFSKSKIGLALNAAGSFEFSNGVSGGDGADFDMKFYVEAAGLEFSLGYIQTGKDSGWGSLNRINNTISPLGVENVLNSDYALDTSVFYAGLGGTFDQVTLGLLYGVGLFTSPSKLGGGRHIQNEVDFAMGFNFTNNVSAFINVYNTHLANDAIPNVIQIQGGINLSF